MNSFKSIKELLTTLSRERILISEMFEKRTSLSFKYNYALDLVDAKEERIEFLIEYGVLRENGGSLEIDDQFMQFFEQVLEVNEEINPALINTNIQNIKENIDYYLKENNKTRQYDYLRKIKNALRKMGIISLRNVVDLKRNIDISFKNEPNYKVKKAKLEHLDQKRIDIDRFINEAYKLVSEQEYTFFKTALDDELNVIIIELKHQLNECKHNLIESQKQIIEYLNQIKHQTAIIEKLRQLKYLKDQFTLGEKSNIKEMLRENRAQIFEAKPSYPVKLSLEYLQFNNDAYQSIIKLSGKSESRKKLKQAVAGAIAKEYLDGGAEEEIQINLEELKNNFVASSNNLFDFILTYNFEKEISFDEKVTIYCQIISQYDKLFVVTDQYETKQNIEYLMVYPK